MLTIDRALCLYWTVWKQTYGQITYTKYYILILTTICIALNSHVLFLNGYRTSDGTIICYATRTNPEYIYNQWERVHLAVYNLCPFAIMCICNTYIIYVTVKTSRPQTERTPYRIHRKSLERYRQFTALLIIVTFVFVLLTLPACIYFVFFRNDFVWKIQKTYRYMIQILLNSIQFTSHGINFFLYCFSAKSFRYELHAMFRELLSHCRCKYRLSCVSTRHNNHIRQYVNYNHPQTIYDRKRLNANRRIQMNHYKFTSTFDKNLYRM